MFQDKRAEGTSVVRLHGFHKGQSRIEVMGPEARKSLSEVLPSRNSKAMLVNVGPAFKYIYI